MENAATSILKAAAPVCSRTWNVYVERSHDGKTCQFGVFCGSFDPSSLNIDEVVLSGYDGFPVVRIAQSSNNKVEVRNNAGSAIEFRFNADSDIQELGHRARITELASIIASGHTDTAPAFAGFVERALAQAIRESHGTLIAVLPGDVSALPELLSDATMLQPAVDLFDRHSAHIQEGKTALSVGRLQAASELVAGFIRCDGITVFNCHGQILGYRAFVNAPAPANPSGGGARTRAFVALGKYVGNGLQAAYFRSQDGKTDLIKK
jgi:hypothetical protein